jgi:hypothetical protein
LLENENVTSLKIIVPNSLFCGQALGYLTVVNTKTYPYSIDYTGKVGDKNDRSHINSITKTPIKGLYVVGTNRGLALIKTIDKNIKVEKYYFKDRIIKSVAFLSGSKVVFSFDGQDKLNIFDLGINSIVNTI